MPSRLIESHVLYDGAEVMFVGSPDAARSQLRRLPHTVEKDESIHVEPHPPRKVLLSGHLLSVTVARSLAGMIERAVNEERPGNVGGVQIAPIDDGVVQLT